MRISTGILAQFLCKGIFGDIGSYLDTDGLVFLVVVRPHSNLSVVRRCFHYELEFVFAAQHEARIVVYSDSNARQALLL